MAKNESSENYLEAILMLSKKLPVVRSVDIANELGFKKSSVSIAMKKLRQENHITVTDAGFIYLTDSGKEIANMIYERHEFISKWLISLGVSKEVALEDAGRRTAVDGIVMPGIRGIVGEARVLGCGQLQESCENCCEVGTGELTVRVELTVIALNDAVAAPTFDGCLSPVSRDIVISWLYRACPYREQADCHGKRKKKR